MRAIMADNDVIGQINELLNLCRSDEWREIWLSLNLTIRTFAELSLESSASDAEIWQVCQRKQIVLITGNRNKTGADSLEETIRVHGTPTSLPVLTIAAEAGPGQPHDMPTVSLNRCCNTLLDIDNVRGAGRLWLP